MHRLILVVLLVAGCGNATDKRLEAIQDFYLDGSRDGCVSAGWTFEVSDDYVRCYDAKAIGNWETER